LRIAPKSLISLLFCHHHAILQIIADNLKKLNDSRYKGMKKWEYKTKSKNGNDSVVHYVKDPKTGKLMDFK
jgi:hypothetical protein